MLPRKTEVKQTNIKQVVTITDLWVILGSILNTNPIATAPLIIPANEIKKISWFIPKYPTQSNQRILLQEFNNWEWAKESPTDHNNNLCNNQTWRPVEFIKWEECEAYVWEHKCLNRISNNLKGYWCYLFGLRRQVVPCVVSHQDSASQQSYNSGTVY